MSHYHCEIVMPPTDDIQAAVGQILAPFDENGEDADGCRRAHAFWDWWVIGGRWAGAKAEAGLDQEKLEAFRAWLTDEKVMVKGFQAGKQELADFATVEKVDAKWREMFPGAGPRCTMFRHSNDQYREFLPGDVMRLGDLPGGVTCARAIVSGKKWESEKLEAKLMVETSFWNGVSWNDTAWDGSLKAAIAQHVQYLERAQPEYRELHTPTDEWLVVTVDYHS